MPAPRGRKPGSGKKKEPERVGFPQARLEVAGLGSLQAALAAGAGGSGTALLGALQAPDAAASKLQPQDYQQTLRRSFVIGGIGAHTGEFCVVRVAPVRDGLPPPTLLAAGAGGREHIRSSRTHNLNGPHSSRRVQALAGEGRYFVRVPQGTNSSLWQVRAWARSRSGRRQALESRRELGQVPGGSSADAWYVPPLPALMQPLKPQPPTDAD